MRKLVYIAVILAVAIAVTADTHKIPAEKNELTAQNSLWPDIPWTPAMLTTEAWFDAADAGTITEVFGAVTQWDDKSGNDNHAVQTNGFTSEPTYTASDSLANNLGSIGSTVSTGKIGLNTPSMTAQTIYAVVYYKDGVDSLFDGFETLISNESGARPARILGTSGGTDWLTTGSNEFNEETYVNGSNTTSNTALPMPLTMFRFRKGADQTQAFAIGYNQESANRSWIGAYCEFVFTDGEETLADQQKIEGYLAWKWGLEAELPTGHPYKDAPPTK